MRVIKMLKIKKFNQLIVSQLMKIGFIKRVCTLNKKNNSIIKSCLTRFILLQLKNNSKLIRVKNKSSITDFLKINKKIKNKLEC